MAHYFEIKKNKAGEYVAYFKYNNEAIWWSEGYASKASAQNAIESVKKNGPISILKELPLSEIRALTAISAPDQNLILHVDRASEAFKALEAAFLDLSEEIRKVNDLRGFTSDELDVARQEISEVGQEVSKNKFRAAHLWNVLKSSLSWIAEKSADAVIQQMVLKLLKAAARLLGIDFPLA